MSTNINNSSSCNSICNQNTASDIVESSCYPSIYTIPSNSVNSLIPIFFDTILECIKFSNFEYMYSSPIQFTIDSIDSYLNNSPVCINNIWSSYNCIGLTTPNSFYLCGNENTFNNDGYSCQCTVNSLPDYIEAEKNATIMSADNTINLANSVLSATTLPDKYSKAIATAQSLGNTVSLASKTVNDVINFTEPSPTPGSINQAIVDFSNAINYISDAADKSTILLNGTTGQEPLITQIALDIYNPSSATDSAVEYIINAANIVKNYPNAPASAIAAANAALTTASQVENLASAIAANPSSQNFDQIATLILSSYVSAAYAYNAINDLIQSVGGSTLEQYLPSLGEVLYAIYLLNYTSQSIYDSNSYDPSTQSSILDNAARSAIDSANYSKLAVNFINSQTTVNLYNDFNISLNSSQCNCKCCCKDESIQENKSFKQIFFQRISSFKVCDLKISICGTIGCKKFTATANYPGITSLEDLGLNLITISSLLCIPQNSNLTIRENLNPCFSIQCVIPTSNYDESNPQIINASLYSYFNLDTNISITKKKPLATLTRNVDWNCSNNV